MCKEQINLVLKNKNNILKGNVEDILMKFSQIDKFIQIFWLSKKIKNYFFSRLYNGDVSVNVIKVTLWI